jgi:5-methylcytosine-specific restriction protein A
VCDHVTPHRGDAGLFFDGPVQSLCQRCHNGLKQRIEKVGYDNACDITGRPIDPNHPSNNFE